VQEWNNQSEMGVNNGLNVKDSLFQESLISQALFFRDSVGVEGL
jgi:hypothetical protein